MMFTLSSSHFLSLVLASLFAISIHFSLMGFTKTVEKHFLFFILFPFMLMGLSLFLSNTILIPLSYFIFFFGLFKFFLKKIPVIPSYSKKEWWLIWLSSLFLLTFLIESSVFKNLGNIQDAMVYHLGGPKEWALHLGGAKFNPNNPISYTTSYFDYYYYYFFLLAKPLITLTQGMGTTNYEFILYTLLLSAQMFSGIIAVTMLTYLILKLASKAGLGLYKYLVLVFIFGLRLYTWTWFLPKNDTYPILCYLMAVDLFVTYYILKNENNDPKPLFFSFLLIGIGTASKLTNAYVVVFSLLFFLCAYFKELKSYLKSITIKKAFGIAIMAMGLGVSLFLLRNGLQTGNPLYPTAKFGFMNTYLSDYADRPELYSDPTTWANAFVKIRLHFFDHPQLILILLAALFFKPRSLTIFYIAAVIYMAKQTGPMYNFRMTSSLLVIALIIIVLLLKELKKKKWFNTKPFSYIFILFIIFFSKVQIEKFIKYPVRHYSLTTGEVIREHYLNWDKLIETNLTHKNDSQYIFAPEYETFLYFSRFPSVSLYDSVPEHRVDYFKK